MRELLSEEAIRERSKRRLPSEEDSNRFAQGMEAIRDKLYAEHLSNIDTEVYVYTRLGEYSSDYSRIVVHTEVIEEDISPFQPESAQYAWYGAGILDAQSGEVIYLDGGLYYRGNIAAYSELHHGVVLDHNGGRLLEYGTGLTIRKIPGGGDVKKLGTGEFLYAHFMDDDRYVLCMDVDYCGRIIDSVTGLALIEQQT